MIDQSPEVQSDGNKPVMQNIYSYLESSLLGKQQKVPNDGYTTDLTIDPQEDQLSIYGFGLTGCGKMTANYGMINKAANSGLDKGRVYDAFVHNLIYKYASLRDDAQNAKSSVCDFLSTKLAPAMGVGGHTPQASIMANSAISGTTFSYYVYPSILDSKFISKNVATNQYIILVVTNYQSGLDDLGTSEDKNKLIEMLGESHKWPRPYYNYITNKLSLLSRPFYQIPVVHIDFGAKMLIDGFQLGLKSLQGVSAYITSNLILNETGTGETTYDLDAVNIIFNKGKSLVVDSIVMQISDSTGMLYSADVLREASYDEEGTHSYTIPPMTLELNKVFNVDDNLKFKYVFFTSSKDDGGNTILPLVFTTERNYTITEETLKSPEEEQRKMTTAIVIAIAALIAIALLLFIWHKQRGKNRTADLKFTIWPVSHNHFMEVKDKKAISLDCWYWKEGKNDVNISVSGEMMLRAKKFASTYPCRIEACVQDIDTNDDFSFRPDPNQKDAHGANRIANKWYEVPMQSDGSFSFSVNAYVEQDRTPNFNKENILKMRVSVRCIMRCDGKDYTVGTEEATYSFIVKPELDNSNVWIAFDPGTTGSCVAFGVTGNTTDRDDISMAENEYEDVDLTKKKSPIFPSMIRLDHKSDKLFNGNIDAANLQEGNDFLFGNDASILWDREGVNCFQSIKKLLGYTDPYKIVSSYGDIKEISGQDLAHLLVRGLCNHVEQYIKTDKSVQNSVRDMFVHDGKFCPQRAIVAVPNNYTMLKVQDMVDTVKRTNKFKEVHYIYEAEAVMMMYLRGNWKNLENLQTKKFVVFDMGGATINATVFEICVTMGEKNGNKYIRRIDVDTVSKIGYGVGGDDIDFAIIQILYSLPSVKMCLEEEDCVKHQHNNKKKLIELARQIKLELIDKANADVHEGSHVTNSTDLYGYLYHEFGEIGVNIDTEPSSDDLRYLNEFISINDLKANPILRKYVYDNVKDAVDNLLSSVKVSNADIELIMSGRSVLFPGISDIVKGAVEDKGHNCSRWSGLDDGYGHFSAEKVKTAVATGASWYAMYSEYIKMHNNITTSTFGFIDKINGEAKFVPVVKRGMEYDEDGVARHAELTRSDLADVKFVQMLCAESEYDKVLENDIRHKYNKLDEVRPSSIPTQAEKVQVAVDDCGNFSYDIFVKDQNETVTPENNPYSRLAGKEVKTEIVEENSDSYIFATLNPIEEDKNVISRFLQRISGADSHWHKRANKHDDYHKKYDTKQQGAARF